MELHYGKLQLLNAQRDIQVAVPYGQPLSSASGMTYFGTVLTEDGCLGNEPGRRIGCAKAELTALSKVWKHSSLTTRRKL